MPDPNEPRLLPPRGDGARKPEFENTTGNAGRDGFTRVARRRPQSEGGSESPYPMIGGDTQTINPPVGERDYGRGPRFSEDY